MRLIGGTKKTEIFILMDIYHIKKYNATKLHVKHKKKNAVDKEFPIPTHETQVLQFSLYSDYLHESVSSFEHMEMYFQIIFEILEKFTIFIIDHLPRNEPLNGKY